jgi:hypothetical protein
VSEAVVALLLLLCIQLPVVVVAGVVPRALPALEVEVVYVVVRHAAAAEKHSYFRSASVLVSSWRSAGLPASVRAHHAEGDTVGRRRYKAHDSTARSKPSGCQMG